MPFIALHIEHVILKKLISILFLAIYANVGFGASIDSHYCGGKLVELKICGITVKSDCPMKSLHAACCKNKVHFCKSDNHKAPTVAVVTSTETSLKAPFFSVKQYDFSLVVIANYNTNHFPSGDIYGQLGQPLFISNCVFRI